MGERQRFVRAQVSPEMVPLLAGQQPGRPPLSELANKERTTMREERTIAAEHEMESVPAPGGLPRLSSINADSRRRASHSDAGIQRLLDAWGRATLAERNAFLWLAAEEIQAAQEGEFQNALTTPQARGNGPSIRTLDGGPGRERAHGGLSAADLVAAEAEAVAWLDEEEEQARRWRDDAAAAPAQGILMPWEQLRRSFATPPTEGEGQSAAPAGARDDSGLRPCMGAETRRSAKG